MFSRSLALPTGFVTPCLQCVPHVRPAVRFGYTRSSTTGSGVIARKNGKWVRLYSRPGNDLTHRFPLICLGARPSRCIQCTDNATLDASHQFMRRHGALPLGDGRTLKNSPTEHL